MGPVCIARHVAVVFTAGIRQQPASLCKLAKFCCAGAGTNSVRPSNENLQFRVSCCVGSANVRFLSSPPYASGSSVQGHRTHPEPCLFSFCSFADFVLSTSLAAGSIRINIEQTAGVAGFLGNVPWHLGVLLFYYCIRVGPGTSEALCLQFVSAVCRLLIITWNQTGYPSTVFEAHYILFRRLDSCPGPLTASSAFDRFSAPCGVPHRHSDRLSSDLHMSPTV